MFSMSVPFGDFGCVRTPLSAVWGARPFVTTHPSSRARLGGLVPPLANDARPAMCSGLRGCGVGGAFFIHVGSVFFLSKKVITNGYENFVAVRNAAKRGGLWIA
jgi:hypothetical protein